MSDVTLDFAHRSKAFAGTPLADLLLDAGFPPLDRSHEKSDAVVALQTALNELGYDCGAADGKFGPGTAEVVKAFQKDVVSKVRSSDFGAESPGDGRADWLTLLALDAACSAKEGGALAGPAPAAGPGAKPAPAGPKPAAAGGGAAPPGGEPGPGKDPAPPADPAQPKSTVRPGYDLLPEDMKARYLKMSFAVDGNQIDISLEHLKYQNMHFKDEVKNGVKVFNESCKDFLVSLIMNELQKKEMAWLEENIGPRLAKGTPAFVARAFMGKGSPDDIQAVLKIAAKITTRLRGDWRDQGSLSATLADFYHRNMGLDCNGFAGNYAKALGTSFGPESAIPSFAPPGKRRRKLDEILPGDVIIWDPTHIATIQGRRDDGDFSIVESNGEAEVQGLGNTTRRLKETGGDTFRIQKVYPDRLGNTETVFVATLK
jgi:peptidoglycan hydrolase-like protein with peptidoglycan-binding domain